MAVTELLQAIWGAPAQRDRLLRLSTPLGRDTLVAERLDGWEAVDHGGFRLEVTALSANAHLSLDALTGAPVLLELLTADSRSDLRPFHGHVTAVERLGGNGGLARYRLVIEPWLALLRYRQDSYAFHDLSVIEIVEAVFGHYAKGVVVPVWRWELADRSACLKRSLTTQYQESDYAFVARLLAEEGIFYWFEHAGDAASPLLGAHTLVLADGNGAFRPGDAATLRFHRADATEKDDTIQRWEPRRRWQTGRLARASWDYRTLSLRPASAQADGPAAPAVDDDTAGPYAWVHRAQGEARARQQLDARHADSCVVEGRGTARRLAPGASFRLGNHSTQDGSPLAVLRVHHHARNNLAADVQGRLETLLGSTVLEPLAPWARGEAPGMTPVSRGGGEGARPAANPAGARPAQAQDDPLYANVFTAIPIDQPYRPHTPDGHGLRRHPAPTASGSQSAIVTGAGASIHTDRDHRVIVQQHWQRGGNGAGRQDHPRTDNAPADASSGTWARVVTSLAGGNWGSVLVPRVGQEVWLDYLEGDIDRPVIVASLYNGQGNADAPFNQQAGGPSNATGNAAAWFTGNRHAGVLSGFKSQDLATSQSGSGGYRQLRFDDTPAQAHAQLATTDDETALTLGHWKGLLDNARQTDLGYGASLTTLAQGALRAGNGLYVTSSVGRDPLDAGPAVHVLSEAARLATSLAGVARKQQAALEGEPAADQLPAMAAQTSVATDLLATAAGGSAGMGIGGGEGAASAWARAHLVVHGQAGLVLVTPGNHLAVSGADTSITAGGDLDWIAQGQWSAVAARGIALYTQGSPAGSRPITDIGIKLHAASGSVSVQAQDSKAGFAAQKAVMIATSHGSATLQAKGHLLLTAAGAYLKLQGGDIEIGGPGTAFFKGAQREMAGPQSANAP